MISFFEFAQGRLQFRMPLAVKGRLHIIPRFFRLEVQRGYCTFCYEKKTARVFRAGWVFVGIWFMVFLLLCLWDDLGFFGVELL